MPRPVYIICYTIGSVDKDTGLISLFNVVDKLNITQITFPPDAKGALIIEKEPLHVAATWMKLPNDDQNEEYEFEFTLFYPDGKTADLGHGKFQFTENRPLQRLIVPIRGQLDFKSSGIANIECTVHKVGDKHKLKLRQGYPVIVEMTSPAAIPLVGTVKPTDSATNPSA